MKKSVLNLAENTKFHILIQSIKHGFREARKAFKAKRDDKIVIRLEPNGDPKGKVLFSYIIDGFLLKPEESIPNSHTNFWQSLKMAETFVELGYIVDVISWRNTTFIPKDNYYAFVDVRRNMERLAPLLNKDCIKIIHLDTSNILFHNAAESLRLLALQQRRGITALPHRFELPNLAIEHADVATTCGNQAVNKTFEYSGKSIFNIPSPCATTYEWIDNKNWNAVRKNFLWFSSSGLVHKGLDLVLEAFADLPDHNLTICAPLEKDADFVKAFENELYSTSNITTIGWINIESDKFINIIKNNIAVLHTSCSEGGAPSVKTCMHAGLIPVISYETGVDVEDFGIILDNCSIEEIKNSVKNISKLEAEDLESKSRSAWSFARKQFTRENFSARYKEVITSILNT